MWTSFYDDFISYSRPVLVAVGCAHLHGTHHMSSIHSPQHPFSRCGRVGFPQTIFHEDSKIALGLLFHFTCFLFSVVHATFNFKFLL